MMCSSKKQKFHLRHRYAILFFTVSLIIYTVMTYGGIRSPDCELVFRTAESLLIRKSWAVEEDLPWRNFGLRKGRDGKRYSWFGPGEIVMSTPLLGLALSLNKLRWYERYPSFIPISHYIDKGLYIYLTEKRPENIEPHAVRLIVSFLNVVVSSASVVLFFLIMTTLTQSSLSACYVTVLFAFGSLAFPYSGTFFSEPLATFFVLLSFYYLLHNQLRNNISGHFSFVNLLLSGLFLGAATATHISAILFAPFFSMYAIQPAFNRRSVVRSVLYPGISFALGLLFLFAILGYYNYMRFGNIFETGRTADPHMIETGFVAPWNGLKGLLISGGKGLFWFSPAIILSLLCWRYFHLKWPCLSVLIASMVSFRILFLACRSDWHAGFCLGPRYLLLIIPFLLMPLGCFVDNLLITGRKRLLWVFIGYMFLCISQQVYFCVGEIFSFLHVIKLNALSKGFDVFKNDFLYLSWDISPLLFLLDGKRGPFLFTSLPLSNYALWYILVGVTGFLLCWMHIHFMRRFTNL